METRKLPATWPNFTPIGIEGDRDANIENVVESINNLSVALRSYRTEVKRTTDDISQVVDVTEAAGVPSSTPDRIGKYYLDTSAKDMYISVGTSSSADWKKITP